MSGFTITAGVSFSGGFTFTEAPVGNAWFGGGTTATNPQIRSTVDRITYATDTETALVRGPLSQQRYGAAAAGNTYNGWWAGGFQYIPGSPGPDAGPFYYSRVDRITYATDTDTASVRGPLSQTKFGLAAASNISLA